MHLFAIPAWFNCLAFVAVAVLAIWKGGRREIIIAVALAIEGLVSAYVYPVGPTRPTWREPGYDAVILAICIACVVRADRYWTLWACSFALLGEISDFTIFSTEITRWATFPASLVWSYAVAAAVLWGVLTRRASGDPTPTVSSRRTRT